MDDIELGRLRRSVAMLPVGHGAGALTRHAAEALLTEIDRLRAENAGYTRLLAELRRLLDGASGAAC